MNTLGMKFVPVPITGGPTGGQRLLFSVWETRAQDYEVFAKETKREWPKADHEQGPTHPAVMVTWDDARAFCMWLTERERKAGRLGAAEGYRLPADHEWSCAVGIGGRENPGALPKDKAVNVTDVYPWGSGWPPPAGAGNYAGEEAGKSKYLKGNIAGYRDGYAHTSPVGSFAANLLGLYDLSGKASEWCEDWFDGQQSEGVMRGERLGITSINSVCAPRGATKNSQRLKAPPGASASSSLPLPPRRPVLSTRRSKAVALVRWHAKSLPITTKVSPASSP